MRDLTASLKLLVSCSLLICTASYAKESLEDYLSSLKLQEFSYESQRIYNESSKLRDSWIEPIILRYSNTRSNPYGQKQRSQSAAISIDQPIFRSGGIYFGIKFADASRLYSNYSLDVAKKKMIKDTISILMQIQKSDLTIAKQKLVIENAQISLEQKQEQYLNGQLDSAFLDSAIIEKNSAKNLLYDLLTNREKLISKFNVLSDLDPTKAEIPHLKLISDEEFLASNIAIDQLKSESVKNYYAKNMTVSQYLPAVKLSASRSWEKQENMSFGGGAFAPMSYKNSYESYGLSATMPLNINMFNDIESSKVTYLKSKVMIVDKKRELHSLYDETIQNLKNIEHKKELTLENMELYEKLYKDTTTLFKAGYKTEYDHDNMKNSLQIQKEELKILDLDYQLELLNLYEFYSNKDSDI